MKNNLQEGEDKAVAEQNKLLNINDSVIKKVDQAEDSEEDDEEEEETESLQHMLEVEADDIH